MESSDSSMHINLKLVPEVMMIEDQWGNYDEEEGGGMELQSYEVSSPAPNQHSPHMPNQPSIHPQATSKSSSPSPPDDIGVSRQSRYLSPKARQHYRYRDQGRLRSLGFTHIP